MHLQEKFLAILFTKRNNRLFGLTRANNSFGNLDRLIFNLYHIRWQLILLIPSRLLSSHFHSLKESPSIS